MSYLSALEEPQEVCILQVKWAPDWPHPGGWVIEGVYATPALAEKRVEQLKEFGSRMEAYHYESRQVIR